MNHPTTDTPEMLIERRRSATARSQDRRAAERIESPDFGDFALRCLARGAAEAVSGRNIPSPRKR